MQVQVETKNPEKKSKRCSAGENETQRTERKVNEHLLCSRKKQVTKSRWHQEVEKDGSAYIYATAETHPNLCVNSR